MKKRPSQKLSAAGKSQPASLKQKESKVASPAVWQAAASGRSPNESADEFLSPAIFIQEITKIFTGVLLVLLSLRGLLAFYGAKQGTWLEQLINFVTEPILMPFRNLFWDAKAGEIPVFFSMLSVLFIGVLVYLSIGLASKYALWQKFHEKKPMAASGRKIQSQSRTA